AALEAAHYGAGPHEAPQGSESRKAPGVVKSVAATILVIMMYIVYTIRDIQSRPIDALNPTDHVLLVNHMLEASLMGILLFLSIMIGRLHQLVQEQDSVEADIKAEEVSLAWKRHQLAVQLSTLKREKLKLETKIQSLEYECGTTANKAALATDAVSSLKMQSEGFQLEYMRTLEYNQSLRNQLQSIDHRLLMEDQRTRWTHLISSIVQWANKRADAVTAVGPEDVPREKHKLQILRDTWPLYRNPAPKRGGAVDFWFKIKIIWSNSKTGLGKFSPRHGAQRCYYPFFRFSLLLSWIINRLHHYTREIRLLRKAMGAVKEWNRAFEDDKKEREKVKSLGEEVSRKYDRLLEENRNLQNLLQLID
ncbi:hypothetical protein RJ639_028709, partial [Escallonia herrerae]